jgi:hypothetical protein
MGVLSVSVKMSTFDYEKASTRLDAGCTRIGNGFLLVD